MNHRWDTSGKTLRRLRVVTSSGEVPDVASLVRAAREKVESSKVGLEDKATGFYRLIERLCDALEERERENEDLRCDLIDTESQLTAALRRGETAEANVVGLERGVERLRKAINKALYDIDDWQDLAEIVTELAQTIAYVGESPAAREREEMGRNDDSRILAAIAAVRSWYPEDVFLPTSHSPDALAAKVARLACDNILSEYEALRGESVSRLEPREREER